MKTYYPKRRQNIFSPESEKPFALSRSKIELFLKCPRCFYLDRRLGISPPRGFPFNLNDAVDLLLKKEFDEYRKKQEPHPLMKETGLDLVPMQHQDLNTWRDPFTGVRYLHEPSNFIVFGGIDDVWNDKEGTVYVADYKATSKDGEVDLNAPWQKSYKNQIEIYQWLLRKNEHTVSNTGYFVYANGDRTKKEFNNTLHFKTKVLSYTGSDDWIEEVLLQAKETLMSDEIPKEGSDCELCPYRHAAGTTFKEHVLKHKKPE